MLSITTKEQYFSLLDRGFGEKNALSILKDIQDAWILGEIGNAKGLKIAEIGGGNSRILPKLRKHECHNIEKFEGLGNGPTDAGHIEGVKTIAAYVGEFSEEIPRNYYDLMVSISVVEHIAPDFMKSFFLDIERCLRKGGKTLHAVDLIIGDKLIENSRRLVDLMTSAIEQTTLQWISPPTLKGEVLFSSRYASMCDLQLWKYWRTSERLEELVKNNQVVNVEVGCWKP
jgi:hypothetical protein